MAIREPGEPGTQVGQIKTPMCSENVGRKNTPGEHKYPDMPSTGGDAGLVKGPGAQVKSTTSLDISGSNLGKRRF